MLLSSLVMRWVYKSKYFFGGSTAELQQTILVSLLMCSELTLKCMLSLFLEPDVF